MNYKDSNGKEIKINSLVTVTHPEWRFTDKQGVVIGIKEDGNKDGPIGVQFHPWYKYLFDNPRNKDIIVRFTAEDIRVDEKLEEIPTEGLSVTFFNWLPRKSKSNLIIGQTKCQHPDCNRFASFEICVNIWGTNNSAYACSKHAYRHGCWSDDVFSGENSKKFTSDDLKIDKSKMIEISIEKDAQIIFDTVVIDKMYKPNKPFIPSRSKCQYPGCEKLAVFNAFVCIKGIVYVIYTCQDHVQLHGCEDSNF